VRQLLALDGVSTKVAGAMALEAVTGQRLVKIQQNEKA
jgi:hypothetical protein